LAVQLLTTAAINTKVCLPNLPTSRK